MQYCKHCGKPMEDNARFCTACGAKNEPTVQEAFQKATNMQDTTAAYDENDIQKNKVMAVMAYLGILVLIPIFAAKQSPFARFHANQGLVLFIASVIVETVTRFTSDWVGLLALALFVLRVIGIVWAIQGKAKELPLIGALHIIK